MIMTPKIQDVGEWSRMPTAYYRPPDVLSGWDIFVREYRDVPPDGLLEFWITGADGQVWYWAFPDVVWRGVSPGRWGGLHGEKDTPKGSAALVDALGQTGRIAA
jgi:hypothetical protein